MQQLVHLAGGRLINLPVLNEETLGIHFIAHCVPDEKPHQQRHYGNSRKQILFYIRFHNGFRIKDLG